MAPFRPKFSNHFGSLHYCGSLAGVHQFQIGVGEFIVVHELILLIARILSKDKRK
jgi:hypothetical protein